MKKTERRETLKNGDKVTLIGFGSFDVLETKAKTGRPL